MNLFDFNNFNYLADLEAAVATNPNLNLNAANPATDWTLLFSAKFAEAAKRSVIANGEISKKIMELGGNNLGYGCDNLVEYKQGNDYEPLLNDDFINLVIDDTIKNYHPRVSMLALLKLASHVGVHNGRYHLNDQQMDKIIEHIKNNNSKISADDFISHWERSLYGHGKKYSHIIKNKNKITEMFDELVKKIDLHQKYLINKYHKKNEKNTGCLLQKLSNEVFFGDNLAFSDKMIDYLLEHTATDELIKTKKLIRSLKFNHFDQEEGRARIDKILQPLIQELERRGEKKSLSVYFINIISYFRLGRKKEEKMSHPAQKIKNRVVLCGIDVTENISGIDCSNLNFDEDLNEKLKNLDDRFKETIYRLLKDNQNQEQLYYDFALRIKTDYFKELRSSLSRYAELSSSPALQKQARELIVEQHDFLNNHLSKILSHNDNESLEGKLKDIRRNHQISAEKLK